LGKTQFKGKGNFFFGGLGGKGLREKNLNFGFKLKTLSLKNLGGGKGKN